jgi:antitoxin ParD1/3/4
VLRGDVFLVNELKNISELFCEQGAYLMQIVTVNLPSIYIDAIAKLTEQGMFPSRSEAIRQALRDFLKNELEMVESLLDLSEKEGKIQVIQDTKTKTKKIDMRSIRAGWT